MNTTQLVELLRTEVRKAIREELVDIIQEAVKIASTPDIAVSSRPTIPNPKPAVPVEGRRVPIAELLEETKLNFTSTDAKAFVPSSQRDLFSSDFQSRPAMAMANKLGMTSSEDAPGLDLSQLSFVKKAKQVLDAAVQKDKQRYS